MSPSMRASIFVTVASTPPTARDSCCWRLCSSAWITRSRPKLSSGVAAAAAAGTAAATAGAARCGAGAFAAG